MALGPMLYGQTLIPNGDFENWENVGANDEEPTNWNGNRTGGGFAAFGPQTCFRESTNPHSGTYCMRLANGNSFGNAVNATGTTGKIEAPSTNPADGYIHTLTGDPDFNSPFTGMPDSLVGWFKYTQGGTTDVGRIQAALHGNYDVEIPDQGASASHVIATALYDLPLGNTATWTRFSVPFVYNNGNTPTHILLIATASSMLTGVSTSTILWVDDLEAIYNTGVNTTAINNSFDSPVSLYPNPTQGRTTLDLGASYTDVEVSVTDVAGRVVFQSNFAEGQKFDLDLEQAAGVYIVSVASETKRAVMKLIKQ